MLQPRDQEKELCGSLQTYSGQVTQDPGTMIDILSLTLKAL